MGAIDLLTAQLVVYPHLPYDAHGATISVPAATETGFSVTLQETRHGAFVVFGGGWHEEFHRADEAVSCFLFGLSTRCRLRVVSRGRLRCRWTVEVWEEGEWRPESTVNPLLVPFWRAAEVSYLQNDWFAASR